MRSVLVATLGAALVLVALPLRAEGPAARVTARIDYKRGFGTDGCPDEAGFRGAVAAQMGYDPFTDAADQRFAASITRLGPRFIATMELRAGNGRKLWSRPPLQDKDCQKLADVMALSIALTLDPTASPGGAPPMAPTQAPKPTPPAPPTLPSPPPPSPPVAQSEKPTAGPRPAVSGFRWRVGVRAAVEIDSAPAPTAGFTATFGAKWSLVSVAAELRGDLPASAAVAGGSGVRAFAITGGIAPCLHWRVLAGCALFQIGAMHGAGYGLDVTDQGWALYMAAGPRAALELPITRYLLASVTADLLVPLRPVVIRESDRDAWTSPPFFGAFGAGLLLSFDEKWAIPK